MTQQEFVTRCLDCPFNQLDKNELYPYSCKHPTTRVKNKDMESDNKKYIPQNCPLKEGPITIQLSKFL